MTSTDPHQMITELTTEHRHAEPYTHETDTGTTWTTRHTVTAPALLDQLGADQGSNTERFGSSAYASKPVVNVEALDTLIRIDLEAARWVRDLGEDDPGDTKACVRLAGSLLPGTVSCGLPSNERTSGCCLLHDIARWWTQARVVSGWDVAPWKPNNTCPACGKRGTLRVRHTDLSAICVECRTTWDSGTITLLAEHVRAQNLDTEDEDESTDQPAAAQGI